MVNADQLLARKLLAALADDVVEPFFQPIVSLDNGHILGLEVLARWNDPDDGFIAPDRFIPIADRFGLLDRLLDQLMRRAFSAAADWPHHLFLGFNVSPSQLRSADLATRIATAAVESSFPLSRVHIEVTESGLIEDLTQPRQTLDRLISLGCMIAMDDFGTGYSSLTWLSTLPFSKLKIDASFVTAMEDHYQSRKIVDAVVSLGHSLGLAVVAEGVETAGQANLLRAMGCRLAQGYLFARPMAAQQVPDLLPRSERSEAMPLEARVRRLHEAYGEDAPVAFTDPAGVVVSASPAFNETVDADGEVAGRHIWDLIGVTHDRVAELRAADLLDEPVPPLMGTMPDGSTSEILIRPVKDESCELVGYSVEFGDHRTGMAS